MHNLTALEFQMTSFKGLQTITRLHEECFCVAEYPEASCTALFTALSIPNERL